MKPFSRNSCNAETASFLTVSKNAANIRLRWNAKGACLWSLGIFFLTLW